MRKASRKFLLCGLRVSVAIPSSDGYGDGDCGAVGLRGGQGGGGQARLNGRERGCHRSGVLRVLRVEAECRGEPHWVSWVEVPGSGLRSIGNGKPRMLEIRNSRSEKCRADWPDRLRNSLVSGVGATHGAIACVAQNAVVPRLEDQVPDSFLVEWRPQLLQRLAGLRLSSAIEIRQDDHQRPVNRLLYWFCIGRFFSQNPQPVAFFRS